MALSASKWGEVVTASSSAWQCRLQADNFVLLAGRGLRTEGRGKFVNLFSSAKDFLAPSLQKISLNVILCIPSQHNMKE